VTDLYAIRVLLFLFLTLITARIAWAAIKAGR